MRKLRVWCDDAGCDRCSKGVLVGKTLFGKNLYFCSEYKGNHKKVDGRECGAFRCNRPDYACCKNCRRGE